MGAGGCRRSQTAGKPGVRVGRFSRDSGKAHGGQRPFFRWASPGAPGPQRKERRRGERRRPREDRQNTAFDVSSTYGCSERALVVCAARRHKQLASPAKMLVALPEIHPVAGWSFRTQIFFFFG